MRFAPECCLVDEIRATLRALFPLCRSLAGACNRETLRILGDIIPLQVHEYASGSKVYDWIIPDEWQAREAWIQDASGRRLVDFAVNNLHLVSYSMPVHDVFTLAELKKHLHWREDLPQAIPYRTSYYKRDWGFCISFEQYQRDFACLPDATAFEVCVDTEFIKGSLSVGDLVIPGDTKQEILLSTYFCHPSLANDNLSGMVLTAYLARELMRRRTRYSYRVVFVPESVGAVAYCAHNEAAMKAVDCGFVITCTAGPGQWGYKASIDEGHRINRIVEESFAEFSLPVLRYPFDPHGSDERQYASPGFRINTVTISKDKYYEYKEYHSSLDSLDFISADALSRTMLLHLRVLEKLEDEVFYKSLNPHCEAMLSPRGLYPSTGGGMMPGKNSGRLDAILWLMMLCDGKTSLQDIVKRTGVPFAELRDVAALLTEKGLLGLLPFPEKPYAL
jgi:aminopeptidase-like protein